MDSFILKRNACRVKRQLRVRKQVRGTSERPRLCISKTNKHLSAQLIDDDKRMTLAFVGTMSKDFSGGKTARKSKETAKQVGEKIAQLAMKNNITNVVFDRGRHRYHGVVAEMANAAREAGLQF